MNISILVYGSENFLTTLPDQILQTKGFSVVAIADLSMAVSHVQMTPPDMILVQASQFGSMELCNWLKEQVKLSWIYTILLEDRPEFVIDKCRSNWDWELEMTSAALRHGADAYIWHQTKSKIQTGLISKSAYENLLLAHLSVGVRKAQKYRDLMRTNDLLSSIALADSLTELNNRRALEWDLPKQIRKARTQQTPLSLIILDVDYFKKINDSYGHLVGDRLLQLLCSRIRHNLRFQDTAFRYGGEEFVIILSNTSCSEAIIVARRLNRVVSEEPFAINRELQIDVTISLGTACLQPEDDAQGTSLLDRADKFLLQAKTNGRNRVMGCADEYLPLVSHLEAVS